MISNSILINFYKKFIENIQIQQIAKIKILQIMTKSCAAFTNMHLTPSLYCMGPKVSEPKKWLVPNFIFKGWEWCI